MSCQVPSVLQATTTLYGQQTQNATHIAQLLCYANLMHKAFQAHKANLMPSLGSLNQLGMFYVFLKTTFGSLGMVCQGALCTLGPHATLCDLAHYSDLVYWAHLAYNVHLVRWLQVKLDSALRLPQKSLYNPAVNDDDRFLLDTSNIWPIWVFTEPSQDSFTYLDSATTLSIMALNRQSFVLSVINVVTNSPLC